MPTQVQLYARNNGDTTVTFNTADIKWELPPAPDPDYIMALPWDVATASGFDRIWDSGQVSVALDREFTFPLSELPTNTTDHAFIWTQTTPQSTVDIPHGLGRPGPVIVAAHSLDHSIEWWNFTVGIVNENVCRLGFDEPTAFIATIV